MLRLGDRIKYASRWLRSVGAYTGPLPFARGRVVALKECGRQFVLATVEWDKGTDPDVPTLINAKNLSREDDCND